MKVLTTFALILTLPVHAAPPINKENVKAFFDAAFAVQHQDHQIAGAVVSVVHEGEVIFKGGYGFADIEERIPADADESLFRIASITKPFVWTAIMQLHEQGKLDINDDVNKYLTEFKIPDTFDEPIRIRHLFTHTPGLEDRAIGMSARSAAAVKPLATYLFENMPRRVRPPGVHASYSNWGAALAGYIVAQVSGQSWADYVDENILARLDMKSTNTHNEMSKNLKGRHAKGYKFIGGEFMATSYEAQNDAPAGLMSTTAEDMTHFMIAHLNGGEYMGRALLSSETTREMQSTLFQAHENLPPMLHGFYRTDRNGQVIFGHGGDVNQFHSNLSLFPESNLGVFVSYNSDSAAQARSNIVPAFIDHFFPSEYLRAAPKPAGITLHDYVGEYLPLRRNQSTLERLANLMSGFMINEVNGNLSVAGESLWIPMKKDEFVGKYRDARMIFSRNMDGKVTHVVIGIPLSSHEKVTGLNAPGNQKTFLGIMMLIALITFAGYGYRAFNPSRYVGLNTSPVLAAWFHAIALLYLYINLVITLSGDVGEFSFGVPEQTHSLLLLMNVNLIIGLYVIFSCARQWLQGTGTTAMRFRYSLVAIMAIINLWVVWYFNILGYPWNG